MPPRIIYSPGEIVGSSGVIFIRDFNKSNPKHRKAYFKCPLCGKEFLASIEHVKSNQTKSCGCLRNSWSRINGAKRSLQLTNQRFGKLVALEPTLRRNRNQVI